MMDNKELLQSVFGLNKPAMPSIVPKVNLASVPQIEPQAVIPSNSPITPEDSASIQTLLWSPNAQPTPSPNKVANPVNTMSKDKGWGQTNG